MTSHVDLDALTLLPEADARRALGDLPFTFGVLRPPYPALGVGVLRVLRLGGEPLRMIAGYDNYERLT